MNILVLVTFIYYGDKFTGVGTFSGEKCDIDYYKDSDGKIYEGTATHAVVQGKSVIHFYTNDTIAADKCFLVSVKGGVPDRSDNLTEDFHFRFLSEYRGKTESNVLFALESAEGFWAPNGSGSTAGLTDEGSSFETSTLAPSKDVAGSGKLTYSFDPDFTGENWQIRETPGWSLPYYNIYTVFVILLNGGVGIQQKTQRRAYFSVILVKIRGVNIGKRQSDRERIPYNV